MTGVGRHLWIDATAGVAGDMLLGALVDAGADLDLVGRAVDAVLPGVVRLSTETVSRAGLRATLLRVETVEEDSPARRLGDLLGLLDRADPASLAPTVRARAAATFRRLAEAEARVHGIDVDAVHFHEVGALDSIADVVGVCAAVEALGIDTVSASPVAVGSGRMRAAHGDLPVPGPAVTELALGWEVTAGGRGELATPTGVALLRTLATTCSAVPHLTVSAVGVGAGSRDDADRPNVTRVLLGRLPPVSAPGSDLTQSRRARLTLQQESSSMTPSQPGAEVATAVVLEANVDDLDPRLWPGVLDALLAAGADDAWLVPILMKKGRPAHTLCVLADPDLAPRLRDLVLAHTTTFGVREHVVTKHPLARGWVDVEVGDARLPVKVAHRDGLVVRATPEFGPAGRRGGEPGHPAGRPARRRAYGGVRGRSAARLARRAPHPARHPHHRPRGAAVSTTVTVPTHSIGGPESVLTDEELTQFVTASLSAADLDGARVTLVVPDGTRSCPLPLLVRTIHAALHDRVASLTVLVALGTHAAMDDAELAHHLGYPEGGLESAFPGTRVVNHEWWDPEALTTIGTIDADTVHRLSDGRLAQSVDVVLNRLVVDCDVAILLGPVFPHEVVGFSGGNKYVVPGVAGQGIIDFSHWLGALITSADIIGTRGITPVRALIDEAVQMLVCRRLALTLVVQSGTTAVHAAAFGPPEEAWAAAADVSAQTHVRYLDAPVRRVLSVMPRKYADMWTGAKGFYKVEPVVADGGQVVVYAPHITTVSQMHPAIEEIGYHCRDYFLGQWERFRDRHWGDLAHSTHLFGAGSWSPEEGERGRVTVTLATGIPEDVVRAVNLDYLDPAEVDVAAWEADPDTLVVHEAGEVLHRLRR